MLENNQVQFEDSLTRQSFVWCIGKITSDILKNELQVVSATSVKDINEKSPTNFITSIDSLPEQYKDGLEWKVRLIKWIMKNGGSRGQRKLICDLLKKFTVSQPDHPPTPSASTVMSWMRLWEESGRNPAALVSGNFLRKRKTSFSDLVEKEIHEVLIKHYFIRTRPSLQNAMTILVRNLKGLLGRNLITEREAAVSESSLRRRVNDVDPYRRDVLRYGAAFARNKWRYSLAGTSAVRALQRLEVDHTILDVVVIADASGMPLGRPVITVIIDAFSGYVVGFYISFSGPGLAAVLNTMKVSLFPKSVYLENASFLTNDWLGYGIGEMYVVDNGLEFHSKQFVFAALELNTDIQYCPVRQPWLKPNIERFFGELGHVLPQSGKVMKPVANVLPIDPRKTAQISFSDLCKGLLQYFVDVHPFKIHSRTLTRPFDLFSESFANTPPPLLPTNIEKLGLIGANQKTLTIGNEGIVMPGLRFNSRELQMVRREIASSFKTQIKYDSEDLGYAYVQHPETLRWLYVPNCHPDYANNLSMAQHNAIRAHMKATNISGDYHTTHLLGKAQLIDFWGSSARGKNLKHDLKSAAQFAGLSSTKSLTNEHRKAPTEESQQLLSKEELDCDESPVPDFEAFILD
jgi:putative transposase